MQVSLFMACLAIAWTFSFEDYVLQRALTVVENDQRELFLQQIKPLLVALRKSTTAYNRPLISSKSIMYAVTWDLLTNYQVVERLIAENTVSTLSDDK